jgi:hypothetical protein
MTKTTKTWRALLCALVLVGAVATTPRTGAAAPAQTVVATTAGNTAAENETEKTDQGTAPDAATTDSGLTVSRLIVATGVDEREPVDPASAFSLATTSHLYAFVELANPARTATDVELVWIDLASGQERRSYTLVVGAHARWRTWARSAVPKKPGTWAVLVRDANGMELARTQYEVIE